jgi:hypothetical protein
MKPHKYLLLISILRDLVVLYMNFNLIYIYFNGFLLTMVYIELVFDLLHTKKNNNVLENGTKFDDYDYNFCLVR